MQTCPELPFYLCSLSQCWQHDRKPAFCALDYFQHLPEEEQEILLRDAEEGRYLIMGIEDHIWRLNHRDDCIFDEEGRHISLRKFLGEEEIKPFTYEERKTDEFDLRCSELGIECQIARILHKNTDHESYFTKAGTALHTLCNQQPVPNYAHNRNFPPRSEYGEKEVFGDFNGVIIKGHPDAAMLHAGENLLVLDFKRSVAERRGMKKQLLAYAMIIGQQFDFKQYILIICLHANTFCQKRLWPRYKIYMPSEQEIRVVEKEIRDSASMQKKLQEDEELRQAYAHAKDCKCYPEIKKACEKWLRTGILGEE
jgi:hypothetical protein